MNVERLKNDYRVAVISFRNSRNRKRRSASRQLQQKILSKESYFVVPDFGYDLPRGKLRARRNLAEELNRLFANSRVLKRFDGKFNLWVGYAEPVAWGSPRLTIRQGFIKE